MKDRFKFRIPMFTDKETFMEFQYLELGDFIECTLCGTNGEPQQCTGLKDKNGKLIYEGDVVKDKCSEAVATIEYLPYTFSLMAHIRRMDDYLPLEDICYALEVATPFEVIGNIYENPELLEKQDD